MLISPQASFTCNVNIKKNKLSITRYRVVWFVVIIFFYLRHRPRPQGYTRIRTKKKSIKKYTTEGEEMKECMFTFTSFLFIYTLRGIGVGSRYVLSLNCLMHRLIYGNHVFVTHSRRRVKKKTKRRKKERKKTIYDRKGPTWSRNIRVWDFFFHLS